MSTRSDRGHLSYGARWGIVAAVMLVAAAYFGFRAYGETLLGVMLTTNPQLENGLALHWTFDSSNVLPATITAEIRDSSAGGNHGNSVFPPNHASSSTSTASTVVFITSGTSWTVPSDWTDSNTIEVIGGGGAGDNAIAGAGAAGGGGGGYSKILGLTGLSPGNSVTVQVGTGGTTDGANGTDTYFCNSTSNCASISGTAVVVGAKGGTGGTTQTANGVGGAAASGVGTIKYSGGDGNDGVAVDASGGGGGAGGPFGSGALGGIATDGTQDTGGGGGGGGGGFPGSAGAATAGGAGGNNYLGTGSGAGGNAAAAVTGKNGGGGGGGDESDDHEDGANGGPGSEWLSSAGVVAGSGGGGGGCADIAVSTDTGGNGGLYGAGGGGCEDDEGDGANGIIVISYGPAVQGTQGPVGQALVFDSVDDKVGTSSSPGSIASVQTIAFWLRISTSTITQKIMNLGGQGTIQVNTNASGQLIATGLAGSAVMYIDGVATTTAAASSAMNTEWHHIVITTGTAFTVDNLTLGSVLTQYFGGAIDDFRLYTRVLSQDEITRLYQLGATTKIATTLATNPTLLDGLLAWLTFDGKDTDLSSSTGEYINRVSTYRANWGNHASTTELGVIGQASWFDGSDDYVQIPGVSATNFTNNFTYAFWMYADQFAGSTNSEFTGWSGGQQRIYTDFIELLTVKIAGVDFPEGNIDTIKHLTALSSKRWYHIAFTFEKNVAGKLYVDSVLATSSTATGNPTQPTLSFLLNNPNASQEFNGRLDDFRMYNRVLSQEEIIRLYQLGATTRVGMTLNTNPALASGLVGHWTMDGPTINWGTNTITDRSGSGNNGTLTSMSTSTSPALGAVGQALWFNGSSNAIDTADINATDGATYLTVAAWVKQDSVGGSLQVVPIVSKGNWWTNQSWMMMTDNPSDDIYICISGMPFCEQGGKTTNNAHQAGVWEHWVFVFDGTQADNATRLKLYKNGVQQSLTYDGTIPATTVAGSTQTVTIGANPNHSDFLWNGSLDDVRIYNRALSATEIQRLYQMGR